MALAAEPLRHPVSELPLAPEAFIPDCAPVLLWDCPLVALLELPIPAPEDEVPVDGEPVEFGVPAVPLLLLFGVPVEFCVPTEPACGLVVVFVPG